MSPSWQFLVPMKRDGNEFMQSMVHSFNRLHSIVHKCELQVRGCMCMHVVEIGSKHHACEYIYILSAVVVCVAHQVKLIKKTTTV